MWGPQVVNRELPPARTMRHSSRTCLTMSGRRKSRTRTLRHRTNHPNSPDFHVCLTKRGISQFLRVGFLLVSITSSRSAKSAPMTRPCGPTALAAGMAEAPLPHRHQGRSIPLESKPFDVSRPYRSQKARDQRHLTTPRRSLDDGP